MGEQSEKQKRDTLNESFFQMGYHAGFRAGMSYGLEMLIGTGIMDTRPLQVVIKFENEDRAKEFIDYFKKGEEQC